MLSKDETIKLAQRSAEQGFLCSESILLALSQTLNVKSDIIPKIATGFGAGIGQLGEVCGAASGAIMGLGLKFGRNQVEETTAETVPYEFSTTMANLFIARFGHLRCRDLIGLNLAVDEDRRAYQELKLWETRCRDIVSITTGLAYDLLEARTNGSTK
ncbi:MAG: C-GCAxxG-C-C family protein [Candidatus Hodarchaeota archaeon]